MKLQAWKVRVVQGPLRQATMISIHIMHKEKANYPVITSKRWFSVTVSPTTLACACVEAIKPCTYVEANKSDGKFTRQRSMREKRFLAVLMCVKPLANDQGLQKAERARAREGTCAAGAGRACGARPGYWYLSGGLLGVLA
eukprot:1277793-Amphidinium_carterae.2